MIILIGMLVGLPIAFLIRGVFGPGWSEVTTVDALEAEDVLFSSRLGIFLVHEELPIGLVAESPHLGEPLFYCEAGQNFVSLAHGETFDRQGRYIDGPAPHGMDRVGVRVQAGLVEINLKERTEGSPTTDQVVPEVTPCAAESVTVIKPGFVEPSV